LFSTYAFRPYLGHHQCFNDYVLTLHITPHPYMCTGHCHFLLYTVIYTLVGMKYIKFYENETFIAFTTNFCHWTLLPASTIQPKDPIVAVALVVIVVVVVHVGFVVDKVVLGQVFLRVIRFSPVYI
jgi:hypothetical protein